MHSAHVCRCAWLVDNFSLRRPQSALLVSLHACSASGWACTRSCRGPICMRLCRARCHAMQLRATRWSYVPKIRTAIRACRYSWSSGFPFNSCGHYNLSIFNLSIAPHNTTSTPMTTHREGMSGGASMEFGGHRVETHARDTYLSVVYTIDPVVVDDYINSVE